jgi:hypothetical protein
VRDSLARLRGASDVEREAAAQVATAARAQPMLRRATAANAVAHGRREAAIVMRLEDQTVVECVSDLAFKDSEECAMVDFKTEGELCAHEQRYRRQVGLFVQGVAEATSRKT